MNNIFNPESTYRIQFHKDFTFSDFQKIIPYLDKLGIKTVYASPVFEAAPGSTHGYDGTDPNKINPEIGTLEQLTQISKELKKREISWLQDIVPNHLSYHENNQWLMDVLEKGQSSEHAQVFDILWDHPDYPGRLMVPFPGSELEKQLQTKFPGEKNYVLCSWQETDHRMNYRRFFLVNTLICTNVHIDEVFHKYHQLIKELVEKNIFQGLRVDHVDGLYDPTKYLEDLRKLAGEEAYLIVEKILEPGEEMPETWPIQGNSGYDFLGIVNNVFTNRASEFDLTAFYFDITQNGTAVHEQVQEKKKMILFDHMGGELDNLTRLYKKTAGESSVEISDETLKENIAAYLITCPVYRYYDDLPLMEMDKGKDPGTMKPFYQRCMQFTGPLMAKGVEDTLMYTYNRFVGHNEVGDSPEFFGYTPQQFHQLMQYRQQHWPLAMNASSTHDTKRGEDVRARLNALTDHHSEWIGLVKQWMKQNEGLRSSGAPDKNDEYFIYQTLAGSYPMVSPEGINKEDKDVYPQRVKDYLEKSFREAKVHSTWTEQYDDYETAAVEFAHALINERSDFFQTFLPFLKKITDYGMINSFGQLVLKCTSPGIPDIYQGTELWDLSLVDPDNRRPVDYSIRTRIIEDKTPVQELWKTRWDGRIKLRLLNQLLKIRNEYNDIFGSGEYVPLEVKGKFANNVLAYARKNGSDMAVVAVALNYAQVNNYDNPSQLLTGDWQDTMISFPASTSADWINAITGSQINASGNIKVQEIFKDFPVAILV